MSEENALHAEVNTISVSSIARHVAYSVKAKRPACFWSRPGVGKSAILNQVAKLLGYHLEDIRLSQIESIDLRGAPTKSYLDVDLDANNNIVDTDLLKAKQAEEDEKAEEKGVAKTPIIEWAMPDFLVRARLKAKEGIPTVFFFDEINHGDESTQAPAYQFILDNRIGCFSLGEEDRVFAACNYENEGSIANPMSLALANRMTHYYVEADAKSFLRYGRDNGLHPMILAAVEKNPALIYLFPKDEGLSKNKSFSTPRTLEYASDYLYQILENQGAITDMFKPPKVEGGDKKAQEELDAFYDLMIKDITPSQDDIEYDIKVNLSGCLGMEAADDIMTYIRIGHSIPDVSHIFDGNYAPFENAKDTISPERRDVQALISNQCLNMVNSEYKELVKLHKEHGQNVVSFADSKIPVLEKAKKEFYHRYENFVLFTEKFFAPDLFILTVVTRLIREMKIQPFKPYMKSAETVKLILDNINRVSQDSF